MSQALYGCHNRAPFRETLVVQDGWNDLLPDGHGNPGRVPKWKTIPFRNRKDCGYTLSELGQRDERCAGCTWKAEKAEHA